MKKLFMVCIITLPFIVNAQLNYNASFTKKHNPERFAIMQDQSNNRYPNDKALALKDLNLQFNAAGNLLSPMRYDSPNVDSYLTVIKAHLTKSESEYNNAILDKAESAKTLNQKDKYIDLLSLLKVDWIGADTEYEFHKGNK